MDHTAPLLVYDRIDANRRNTRWLITAFAVLVMPFVHLAVRHEGHTWWISAGATVALGVALAGLVALLGSLFGASLTLWQLPRGFEHEPQLRQLVENLSIAAGLPPPSLYVMECAAPNAFAVGYEPHRASLVVTRGLLELLDRRELTAVVAHELSHIGNRDTDLSMKLAALLAVTRAPLDALAGLRQSAQLLIEQTSRPAAVGISIVLLPAMVVLMGVVTMLLLPYEWTMHQHIPRPGPLPAVLLLYLFVVAPAIALWLRKSISQQREFLADADAVLLTRDPEGLALALAKVSAASGTPVHAAEATAHLFFVDPLPTSLGRSVFPSHPPVDARVAALARMGDGIVEGLSRASDAGVDYRGRMLLNEIAPTLHLEAADGAVPNMPRYYEPGAVLCLTDRRTSLYASSDRRSTVIADLSDGAVITVDGADNGFYKARTHDGTRGYVDCAAGMRRPTENDPQGFGVHHRVGREPAFTAECVPGSSFRLTDHATPLYATDDGWSRVLQQLPGGQVVTFNGIEGHFARVQAAGVDGYIANTAGAEPVASADSRISC